MTTSNGIRKYDPSAVKRSHIKPVTFLYGADKPGIELRMARFTELLDESGEDPAVLPSASEAVGYMAAGTLFSDSFTVVVSDISDALKSSAASTKLNRQLKASMASNAAGSTFVLAALSAGDSKTLSDFIKFVESLGGVARQVAAPLSPQAVQWAENYLESIGMSLPPETISAVASAANGKPEVMERMLTSMGPELASLSIAEMRDWVDADSQAGTEEIRQALAARNLFALSKMKDGYPPTQAGYRSFLLKLRYAALDLVLASMPEGKRALDSLKSRQYGWDTPTWKIMKLVGNSPDNAAALKAYDAVQDELYAISGASKVEGSYSRMLARIAAAS